MNVPNQPVVAICTPHRSEDEHLSVRWHHARMALALPFGLTYTELKCIGHQIDEARNAAVRACKDQGIQWLFFLDNDVLPPANALDQLVYRTHTHPGFDVYSGVYTFKRRPATPILARGLNTGTFWDWTLGDVLTDGLSIVPLGCSLLRLESFDRLPYSDDQPWFKTVCMDSGDVRGHVTEDCFFFTRLLSEANGKLLCDTRVQCGHQDYGTGEVFCLPEDSPPVTRWREAHRE